MKRFFLLSILLLLLAVSCSLDNQKKEKIKENILYDKAYLFRDSGKIDEAFLYFNKAKDLFLQHNDSVSAGKCLVNMALILESKGDYFGSQEIGLQASAYFDQKQNDQFNFIIANFNNLGISSYKLKEYQEALKFYDLAIKNSRNSLFTLVYLNNKAKTYEELKQYGKALKIYNSVLHKTKSNPVEYARTLTNIAFAKWLQNSKYNAAPELLKALRIRLAENDVLGQNHSYARLADYYSELNPNIALTYALKMHGVAKGLNSPDDRLEALEKLIKLSPSSQAKAHFESFRSLEDSVQMVRNKSKNQFAIIRYETEKHKADNLILQKDNTEKKYQLIKQKALLVAGLAFSFFVIIVSIILYKKRKQRLELASKNAIRENQLKTSKKVHDVVANGLYRIMTKLDNQNALTDATIVDEMESLYETSRNISYEDTLDFDQNYQLKISNLLNSFANDNTEIVQEGNSEDLWTNVSSAVKYEVEHILQELMVNMKKHSSSSLVTLKFEKRNKTIHVYYVDNGIGLPDDIQFKNGLNNTETRIKNIFGVITFDTQNEKGLGVHISFPIS